MIDERLKFLVMPYLKMELSRRFWNQIDSMFNEAYIIQEKEGEMLSLPVPFTPATGERLCFQFLTLNGAYCGVDLWGYVKEHGRKA